MKKAIRQHAFNSSSYVMENIYEAAMALLVMKQGQNETLLAYLHRFKTATEVLKYHIDNINHSQTGGSTDFAKKAYARLLAYIFLINSDKTKYQSFMEQLSHQQLIGQGMYPHTMEEVYNILKDEQFHQEHHNQEHHKQWQKPASATNTASTTSK